MCHLWVVPLLCLIWLIVIYYSITLTYNSRRQFVYVFSFLFCVSLFHANVIISIFILIRYLFVSQKLIVVSVDASLAEGLVYFDPRVAFYPYLSAGLTDTNRLSITLFATCGCTRWDIDNSLQIILIKLLQLLFVYFC